MTPRTDAAELDNSDLTDWGTGPSGFVRVEFARELERELGAKQAQMDRLMLEYCPDEMTPEQIAEWARHQTPSRDLNQPAPASIGPRINAPHESDKP